ncbi:MAG: hypothetical protein ACTHU0_30985 [Kofleriaceae bacterium]
MRLRARVDEKSLPWTTGYFPDPSFLEIRTDDGTAVFLVGVDSTGQDTFDTWHPTLEEAKEAACEKYDIAVDSWIEIDE